MLLGKVITQEDKPNHEAPLPAESRKRKISLFREESLSPQKRIKLAGDSNLKPQAAAPVRTRPHSFLMPHVLRLEY